MAPRYDPHDRGQAWDDGIFISRENEDGDATRAERVHGRMFGWDAGSSTWKRVAVDSSGSVKLAADVTVDIGSVDQGAGGASAWKVDGSAVTQPVSGSITVANFPATQPVSGTVTAAQGAAGAAAWLVDGSAVTQPVSIASLPLPSGASTDSSLLQIKSAIREAAFDAWLAREEALFA